jgi:hypothetical protein
MSTPAPFQITIDPAALAAMTAAQQLHWFRQQAHIPDDEADEDAADLALSPIQDDTERGEYDAYRRRHHAAHNRHDKEVIARLSGLGMDDPQLAAGAKLINWLEHHARYQNDEPEEFWLAVCECSSRTFRAVRRTLDPLGWIKTEYRVKSRQNGYTVNIDRVNLDRERDWKAQELQLEANAEQYGSEIISNKGLDVQNARHLTNCRMTCEMHEHDVQNARDSKHQKLTDSLTPPTPPALAVCEDSREPGEDDEENSEPIAHVEAIAESENVEEMLTTFCESADVSHKPMVIHTFTSGQRMTVAEARALIAEAHDQHDSDPVKTWKWFEVHLRMLRERTGNDPRVTPIGGVKMDDSALRRLALDDAYTAKHKADEQQVAGCMASMREALAKSRFRS